MRWELIDRFELLQRGGKARAVKSFDGKEDFFREHFPGKPVVPETLLVEMIAQAGGVLFGLGLDFKKEVILAKIGRAHFGEPVAPPCRFTIEARVEEENEDGALVAGSVHVNGKTAAEVELLLAAVPELEGRKNVVFNEGFLKHYDVRNIAAKEVAG